MRYWLNSVILIGTIHYFYGMDLDDCTIIADQLREGFNAVRVASLDEQREFYQRISLPGAYGADVFECLADTYKDDAIFRLIVIKNNALSSDDIKQQKAIKEYNFVRRIMEEQLRVLQVGMVPYENLFASVNTTGADYAMRVLAERDGKALLAVQEMDTMLTAMKQEKSWQAFRLLQKQSRYNGRSSLLPSYSDVPLEYKQVTCVDNNAYYPTAVSVTEKSVQTDSTSSKFQDGDDNNQRAIQKKIKKKQYKSKQTIKRKRKKEADPVGPYMLVSCQPLTSIKKDNTLAALKNYVITLYKTLNNQNRKEFYQALFSYKEKIELRELSAVLSLSLAQVYSGEIPYDVTGACKNRALAYQYYKHALKEFNKYKSQQLYISEFQIYIPEIQCKFADFLCKEKMKERYSEACTLYVNAAESGYEEAQFRKVYFHMLRSRITEAYNECKKSIDRSVHNYIKAIGSLFSAYLLVHFKEWSKKQSENPIDMLKQYCNLTTSTEDVNNIATMLGPDDVEHMRDIVSYVLSKKDESLYDILCQLGDLFYNIGTQETQDHALEMWAFGGQDGHMKSIERLADYVEKLDVNVLGILFEKIIEHKKDISLDVYTLFYDEIKYRASCGYFGPIGLVIKESGDDSIEEILNSIVKHKKRDEVLRTLDYIIELKPAILLAQLARSEKFKMLLAHKHDGASWLYIRIKTQLMTQKSDEILAEHIKCYNVLKEICDAISDKSLQLNAYNLIASTFLRSASYYIEQDVGLKKIFALLLDIMKIASDEGVLKGAYKYVAANYLDSGLEPEWKQQVMEVMNMDEEQLQQWCVKELQGYVDRFNDASCKFILSAHWLTKEKPTLQEVLNARKYLNACRACYQGSDRKVQYNIELFSKKAQILLRKIKLERSKNK